MKFQKRNILTGIAFSCIIFLISILVNLSFSYMGVSDQQVTQLIWKHYKFFLIGYQFKILLAYLAIGLLVGLSADLLHLQSRSGAVFFALFFWSGFWLRAVKLYPQLFLTQLFNQSPFGKSIQIAITDFLSLKTLYAVFISIILLLGLRKRRIVGALMVILISFLLIARFKTLPTGIDSSDGEMRPNVLVVATDSLRPQNISHHGYARPTPHIDSVLARGVSFLNAKTSLARTFPLWTSVLTSQFPPDHGIRTMYPSKGELAAKWLTLADVLNEHQYRTFVASDFAGDMFSRHSYGFQKTYAPQFLITSLIKQRSIEIHSTLLSFLVNPLGNALFPEMSGIPMFLDPYYVTDKAKTFILDAVHGRKPFFGIVFFSNNHFPYVSPFPYYRMYAERNYRGKHKYCLSSDMLKSFLNENMGIDDQQQIVNLYDGAAKLFDDQLGEILSFLKRCNLEKNTIVVVMSDHGENLCEPGLGSGHGDHLRGSLASSMLLGISSPKERFPVRIIRETVRDIDIAPTILRMLDIRIPESFRGESLLPFMRGEPFAGLPAYMETGIWYTHMAPFIPDRLRIDYPLIKEMLTLDLKSGEIVIKDEYAAVVINAKHRALQFNEKKFIYMPGADQYREEYYVGDALMEREKVADRGFLDFKNRIVAMFPGRFFLDERGFIREKSR